MTIPSTAYHFLSAMPELTAEEGKQYVFQGLAYSGDSLSHSYWDNVIFDVSTTKSSNSKTPILLDHDPSKRAGFAELSFDNNQISIQKGTLLNNEFGNQVIDESNQGFPWQMSVYIDPSRIEEVQAGVQVMINGRNITGPVSIFRDSVIREVSFTAIGVDSNTHAKAMSHKKTSQEFKSMTEAEIQALKAINEELSASVDAMKASAVSATEKLEGAESRADAAELKLKEQTADTRMSAVKSLFTDVGREYSDEKAKPYLTMDDVTFSAVSDDMKSARPSIDPALLTQQATGGKNEKPKDDGLKYSSIYENRRAK